MGSRISPWIPGIETSETGTVQQFSAFQALRKGPSLGPKISRKGKTLKSPPIAHFSKFSRRA